MFLGFVHGRHQRAKGRGTECVNSTIIATIWANSSVSATMLSSIRSGGESSYMGIDVSRCLPDGHRIAQSPPSDTNDPKIGRNTATDLMKRGYDLRWPMSANDLGCVITR